MTLIAWASRSIGAQTSPTQFETRLAEGIKLLGEGKTPESVQVLNDAKQIAPSDPRPYFYCGIALEQAGKLRDAASELGEAIHLSSDHPEYRVFQAHVLQQLRQDFRAEEVLIGFQKNQAIEQLDPAWLRLLADVYYRLQKPDDVLRVLDVWSRRGPNDARIELYRGQAFVLKGDRDGALACFERSIRDSSENPQAYFELGKILYEKNQLPAARSALLKAVELDGSNQAYLAKLGSVLLALSDPQAAIGYLSRAASRSPAPEVDYVLASAYEKAGNSGLAARYMNAFQEAANAKRARDALRLESEEPTGRAQRLLEKGDTPGARALFEKALKTDPDQWEPQANLAEMDLASGDLRNAYPHLQRLEQLDPESAVGNFLIAQYWFKQKDYERARTYAEKVKVRRPDNSELRALLGDIYLKLGNKQEALHEYQEAVQLDPGRRDLRERLRNIDNVQSTAQTLVH